MALIRRNARKCRMYAAFSAVAASSDVRRCAWMHTDSGTRTGDVPLLPQRTLTSSRFRWMGQQPALRRSDGGRRGCSRLDSNPHQYCSPGRRPDPDRCREQALLLAIVGWGAGFLTRQRLPRLGHRATRGRCCWYWCCWCPRPPLRPLPQQPDLASKLPRRRFASIEASTTGLPCVRSGRRHRKPRRARRLDAGRAASARLRTRRPPRRGRCLPRRRPRPPAACATTPWRQPRPRPLRPPRSWRHSLRRRPPPSETRARRSWPRAR